MKNDKNVILLTGLPGAGKSTIAGSVLEDLLRSGIILQKDIFGYTTARLSGPDGEFTGFDIVTHGGKRAALARLKPGTLPSFSNLSVNMEAFEKTIPDEFERAKNIENPLFHLDEIGLMEKRSPDYIRKLMEILVNKNIPIIGVLKLVESDEFLDGVRALENVETFTITFKNRDAAKALIEDKFKKILTRLRFRR